MNDIVQMRHGRALLPGAAKSKIRRVEEELEDLRATLRGLADAQERARGKVEDARWRIDKIRNGDRKAASFLRGQPNPASQASLQEAFAELKVHERFIERNAEATDKLNERVGPLQELLDRVDRWLSSLEANTSVTLFADDSSLPAINDLAEVRRRIAVIKADMKAIRDTPRCLAELERVVDEEVARLRKAGAPDFSSVIDGEDKVNWPTEMLPVRTFGVSQTGNVASVGQLRTVSVPSMMAWLFPKQLSEAMHKELKAQFSGDGISADDRAARLKDLRADLLGLERVEEHLIASEQPEVPRRGDADLRAFLGLSDDALESESGDE